MNTSRLTIIAWMIFFFATTGSADQLSLTRIEKIKPLTSPVVIRDWKTVARNYDHMVYDFSASGSYLPTVHVGGRGTNYPGIEEFYLDTYIGSHSSGRQAEAINILPSLVGATLVGIDKRADRGYDWVGMSRNFFNRANGQKVYLNGYSASSGSDWWYDVMPNIYFYQLYSLYGSNAYPEWQEQFLSVADQWSGAIASLGADVFNWKGPAINYRAFNLATQKPLATGVAEPEAAGSIAWLLYKAYLESGKISYLQNAILALKSLSELTSNPCYELQLAYGVQVAAAINSREHCSFDMSKLLNWCFDRGALRGWGCIIGEWNGYEMSGLIGEANDGGNDYAFLMNGFQQAAALAPVAKYDKRYARAIAKWILHVAQASRFFYGDGLPADNQEGVSSNWLRSNDSNSCMPFESIKQTYDGKAPLAMGDARRGEWAATNISLYSGSSVGYMAAVVEPTDVEGIISIDVNATDFFSRDNIPTYLYYNQWSTAKSVTVSMPDGTFDLYDIISNQYLKKNVSGSTTVTIPADGTIMIACIPVGVGLQQHGTKLLAGGKVVDYHAGYDYSTLMRSNALASDKSIAVVGEDVNLRLHLRNIPAGASATCQWTVNGQSVPGISTMMTWNAPSAPGTYRIHVTASARGQIVEDETTVQVVSERYDAPAISSLLSDAPLPAAYSQTVTLTATVAEERPDLKYSWETSGGEIVSSDNGKAMWKLPSSDGVYKAICTATNFFGEDKKEISLLVKGGQTVSESPIIYLPLNGDVENIANPALVTTRVGGSFSSDAHGVGGSAFYLASTGDKIFTENSSRLDFTDAVTLSCWFKVNSKLSREQFLISHGSWEERYKLSITPDMRIRWTVNTSSGIVDLDSRNAIETGKFYHVAVVYTGYSMEMIVNGKYDSFAAHHGTVSSTSKDLCYGAKDTGNEAYSLIGAIDEIRVYDTALSYWQNESLASAWELSAIKDHKADGITWTLDDGRLTVTSQVSMVDIKMFDSSGRQADVQENVSGGVTALSLEGLAKGVYVVKVVDSDGIVRGFKIAI